MLISRKILNGPTHNNQYCNNDDGGLKEPILMKQSSCDITIVGSGPFQFLPSKTE